MANTKSAKKRIRQNERRRVRNKQQKSRLKTAIKKVMSAEDGDQATELFRQTSALLDRYASRRLVHPNKAARTKSQLARHVKELGGTV